MKNSPQTRETIKSKQAEFKKKLAFSETLTETV